MSTPRTATIRAAAILGCLLLASPACDTEDRKGQVEQDSALDSLAADAAWQDALAADVDPACPAPASLDTWQNNVTCSSTGLTCPGTMYCSVYGYDVEGTCTCMAHGIFQCDYWCEGTDIGPPPTDSETREASQVVPVPSVPRAYSKVRTLEGVMPVSTGEVRVPLLAMPVS